MRKNARQMLVLLVLGALVMTVISGCVFGESTARPSNSDPAPSFESDPNPVPGSNATNPNFEPEPAPSDKAKVLIAYFSNTGNTENIAKHLSDILDADLYQIIPETAYTPDDLNYNDSSSRSSKEQNDPTARPVILGTVDDMDQYDEVFLGYPIWWGQAPKIISTFLESYDFSGMTIVPFCTSGSSGVGSSATNLHSLVSDTVTWLDGTRFGNGTAQTDIETWVNGLGFDLNQNP
ncbi:flavodoxin-like protein [Natranaerovirga hydrolytica]|uniref:Flavodoxin-like protein n=1 Tax=Natranaerovirga hydrolytica TaxID=680378 RepID=A0A4R1MC53_9FIRM|nr:flavodoxin [Natranaerovirga hydrolytica]TCK89100.1 flavodoxin-like protein [Natranaerovirga hydrolytica]